MTTLQPELLFRSRAAYIVHCLLFLDSEQRAENLGISEQHYEDVDMALAWFTGHDQLLAQMLETTAPGNIDPTAWKDTILRARSELEDIYFKMKIWHKYTN